MERFHQSLKSFLAKQPGAGSIEQLQAQIDRFVEYYNRSRPHRAKGRRPPLQAFESRDRAYPTGPKIKGLGKQMRVPHDKVGRTGTFTLRHRGRLYHIGVGRALRGQRIVIMVAGLDIRVLGEDGELIGTLKLDESRIYQQCKRV